MTRVRVPQPDEPGNWTPHAWCEDADGLIIDPTWTDTTPDFLYREAPDPFEREIPGGAS